MATRNIVPRADGEGGIGTKSKHWGDVYTNDINVYGAARINGISRISSTSYFVGDTVIADGSNAVMLLCIVAGTSAANELNIAGKGEGATINDGTVKWVVTKRTREKATKAEAEAGLDDEKVMTPLKVKQSIEAKTFYDLLPVGWISFAPHLLPKHAKLNGATAQRADYADLIAYVTEHNYWTDDPINNPHLFGRGDGTSTFTFPDYRGRVIQGGDIPDVKQAGLPNITGSFSGSAMTRTNLWGITGACQESQSSGTSASSAESGIGDLNFKFDASKSNTIYGASSTVQPPSITLLPQIKY